MTGSLVIFIVALAAICSIVSADEVPQNTTAPCPSEYEGYFYPSTKACSEYLICFDGFWFEATCPNELWFNPEINACDLPEYVNCSIDPLPTTESSTTMITTTTVPITTTTPQPTTTTVPPTTSQSTDPSTTSSSSETTTEDEGLNKYCPIGVVSALPHPYDCNKFILCFDGTAVERSCGEDLHFSARLKTCALISEANCVLDGTVCPELDDVENIVTVANDYNCQSFYICFKGAPIPAYCGNFTHWNQQQQTCILEERSSCTALSPPYPELESDEMSCKKPGYYVLPHPRDEGKYFFCVDGSPVLTDFNHPRKH